MLVTKERIYSKAQAPTSPYLNSGAMQQATCISLKLNESLLKTPTNPHVNRIWKIMLDDLDDIAVYYTTPDNVFHDTGLRRYFVNLLAYQDATGIIEPKDISTYKYRKLYSKFGALLAKQANPLPEKQKSALIKVLQNLSKSINISINDLHIQINADEELTILKKGEAGNHYIVVGDDASDISYLYISNSPGIYTSLHTSEKITLKNIIDSFSAE
jgi:hypothetical protein